MSPTSPSDTSLPGRLRSGIRKIKALRDHLGLKGANLTTLNRLQETAEQAADRIEALEARNRELEAGLRPRSINEYHEDMGNVLWWHHPVQEPPWVGTTNDVDFDPDWHQWWTPLADPTGAVTEAAIRALLPSPTGEPE